MTRAFGHCPNSFCTPLPALKRALLGTFLSAIIDATGHPGKRLDPLPYGHCPNAFFANFSGATLTAYRSSLENTLKDPFQTLITFDVILTIDNLNS